MKDGPDTTQPPASPLQGPEGEPWHPILERVPLPRLIELLAEPGVTVVERPRWTALARRNRDYPSRDRVLPDDELDFVLEGSITGTIQDQPVTLKPGSLFWMPPGTRHSLLWPTGLVYYHLHFSIERGDTCFRPRKPFFLLHNVWALEPFVKAFCEEVRISVPHKQLRMKAFFVLLLSAIERYLKIQTPAGRTQLLTKFQQDALTRYVTRNISARPGAAELAAIAKLSPNYFSRVFRNTFGMPPRAWLLQQRIQAAVTLLLETPMTVTHVAHDLGYNDIYLFSRQFKHITGMSPSAFRHTYSLPPNP
ncbi:MAG: helix-turn-helix domain-containing protein [Kiritimatiellae bacterium]|nr:helix-turn-helix domain-containing protein [Kiritimatiellia bacterium]